MKISPVIHVIQELETKRKAIIPASPKIAGILARTWALNAALGRLRRQDGLPARKTMLLAGVPATTRAVVDTLAAGRPVCYLDASQFVAAGYKGQHSSDAAAEIHSVAARAGVHVAQVVVHLANLEGTQTRPIEGDVGGSNQAREFGGWLRGTVIRRAMKTARPRPSSCSTRRCGAFVSRRGPSTVLKWISRRTAEPPLPMRWPKSAGVSRISSRYCTGYSIPRS